FLRSALYLLCQQVQDIGPAFTMLLEELFVWRQIMGQYQEAILTLLMEFDCDQRRMIAKHRRIPGKNQFMWAIYYQVLTPVGKDTPIFFSHLNPKGSPDQGVEFNVCANTVARVHPAAHAFWIKPHIEHLFAGG